MAGFYTLLYRVDPSELESLADPELEHNDDTSLWLRNLGDLELVGLWESLPDAESEGTLMADLLVEGEPMILGLPENFLTAIQQLDDNDIPPIAEKWGRMEELASWKTSDLADVIRNIRKLVRDAQSNQQIVVQIAEM